MPEGGSGRGGGECAHASLWHFALKTEKEVHKGNIAVAAPEGQFPGWRAQRLGLLWILQYSIVFTKEVNLQFFYSINVLYDTNFVF